ncbi:uncharacterized protein FYW47_010156 [Aplochiton taeniatus]
MGKPLSRPDCLRQNPRCLGKGDDDEAYIEDCYVPQRSIYDTMRINEQIDQGTKLSQPSRSTLGGDGSTLSSNGTIGTDLSSVFVSRASDAAGVVRRLDERVIFDALKLTGDPQSMSPPLGGVVSTIVPSSSGSGVAAAVTKRRHQGGDKKDNPNRRSWKAFMPASYPEFAERFELASTEGTEKRLSGPGISLSPLQPLPSLLPPSTPTSTPPLPPYTPPPFSSAPHTPSVSSSPSLTPTVSPVPPLQQHSQGRSKQLHPLLQRQPHKHGQPSPSKGPLYTQLPSVAPSRPNEGSSSHPHQSPGAARHSERKREEHHRRTAASPKAGIRQIPEEPSESPKASDSERESPSLEQDQGDSVPLLPPKPVFCPPTKARTWPRSMRGGKRSHGGLRHNFPAIPPLPPLMGEDVDMDEESLYLLDPPSPFLQEMGLAYGGLPLSPCLSQEGGEEGLLGWAPPNSEHLQRTASELKFEEDEMRILMELEGEEEEEEGEEGKEESGMIGAGAPNASPCPSSGAGSDDLFLELERQCFEEEEGVEMSVDGPESNQQCDIDDEYNVNNGEEEEPSSHTDTVFVLFPESESSGDHMSRPDRTGLNNPTQTDFADMRLAETEADLASGASLDREEENPEACVQKTSSTSTCPLNPHKEVEEEEEEMLQTELLECEHVELSMDNEGPLIDLSPEPGHTDGIETGGSGPQQDVDVQTSHREELVLPKISDVAVETTFDREGMSLASLPLESVPADEASASDTAGQATDQETTTSTPKSVPVPLIHTPQNLSAPPSPSTMSPTKHSSVGAGLERKDSEAFVATDSFIYLAVSVPPRFVYLAAPERLPLPRPSDGGSACEDAQEMDLDSYSDGTQSGVDVADGVDFVLGSLAGDSDWESDDPALETLNVDRDQLWDLEWENLEPGLLLGLFRESQEQVHQEGVMTGAEAQDMEPISGDKSTSPSSMLDIDTQEEVYTLWFEMYL